MQFPLCLKSLNMRFSSRLVSSAAAVALTCVVSAAAYYYKSRKTEINEVMIFCKLQFNVFNFFDKLISFIEAAKRSVNVCMPSIHNPAIQARLVELIQRKNIKVRIIIDGAGYNASTASFLKELSDAGAEIKWKVSEYRMQQKYCLVDDEVLMAGTLDWGNDLSFDHWNYVYVTSKNQLVEPVKRAFSNMWNECQTSLRDALNAPSAPHDPESTDTADSEDMQDQEDNLSDNYEMVEQHQDPERPRENTPVVQITA